MCWRRWGVNESSARDADIHGVLQTVVRHGCVLKAKPEVIAYSWGVGAPPPVAHIIVW